MAVHPEDERYKSFHGKTLVHPFSDRKIPVILDSVLVDMALGTGAVKVWYGTERKGIYHNLPRVRFLFIDVLFPHIESPGALRRAYAPS